MKPRHSPHTSPWWLRGAAALAVPALLVLTGCGATIKLLPEPLGCEVTDSLLAQRCAEPSKLPDGASFGQLVLAGIDDRGALLACARHDKLLADTLRECQAAMARYRATIQDINRQAAKP